MMQNEIRETYSFNPKDFNEKGRRRSDGVSFRDIIKEFEVDFHHRHSAEYALNLYCNSRTMMLLERACNAEPFLRYGMDLTQGDAFDAIQDPQINREIYPQDKFIIVYGIDSAFMKERDEYGIPIVSEENGIYPLTLLIDEEMNDCNVRLAVPTSDDDNEEEVVPVDNPEYELA